MLRSTYKKSAPTSGSGTDPPPLPPGWVEHKAPTGHSYYYHAETETSTYTRPSLPSEEPLHIDYGATEPDHVVRASMHAMGEFNRNNAAGPGHFTGGRSYQEHSRRRGNQGDRPKSKTAISSCAPWVLVKTKLGRRFVHNTETKQSLWKFPQDVMMAVIKMDTLEWQEKNKKKAESTPDGNDEEQGKLQLPQGAEGASSMEPKEPTVGGNYDSDSYEEVEVTDDDDDDGGPATTKRPRISQDRETTPPPTGPVEFNEDDIAWQLAQMEGDYSGQYDNGGEHENGRDPDDDEGVPLTAADNIALFRSLLDDSGISPYSVFEKVIEDMNIVQDSRYIALPNTSSRKEAFLQWSKDRIASIQAQKKEQEAQEDKSNDPADPTTLSKSALKDPKIQYLRLLHASATPKLYWPEFKRKYKKTAAMKDLALPDKDREKLYREYISKMKLSDTERRKELVAFLKAAVIPSHVRNVEQLPLSVLRDLRFYLVEERRRDELVNTFLEAAR
ncbi:uncharacterized protein A1O9_04188 [Exophiala aquamarina CBS 119918]|uniref:WW domain-containing protein n=1 Tax=Exophiala aquamarina CBS 119918 TaxID=1182545 RepID=A0A072PGW7_9EURO|nr:uncharacterized protein A1O9_04188 [Exophiala aquamarina CBS 119918]KEF59344.1 hypothetical protein A1O9_04188 [Exophiala aquamarina CBS 119918]